MANTDNFKKILLFHAKIVQLKIITLVGKLWGILMYDHNSTDNIFITERK